MKYITMLSGLVAGGALLAMSAAFADACTGSWCSFNTSSKSASSATVHQSQEVISPFVMDPIMVERAAISLKNITSDAESEVVVQGEQELKAAGTCLNQAQVLSAESFAESTTPMYDEEPWWMTAPTWWTEGFEINTNVEVDVVNENENIIETNKGFHPFCGWGGGC